MGNSELTWDNVFSVLPLPDSLSIGGLGAGETPFLSLTYKLGTEADERLEAFLGAAFGQAKSASKDGTIRVEVKG